MPTLKQFNGLSWNHSVATTLAESGFGPGRSGMGQRRQIFSPRTFRNCINDICYPDFREPLPLLSGGFAEHFLYRARLQIAAPSNRLIPRKATPAPALWFGVILIGAVSVPLWQPKRWGDYRHISPLAAVWNAKFYFRAALASLCREIIN